MKMFQKKNILLLLGSIFLSIFSSCSYVDGLGDDPNNASDAPTAPIMRSAFVSYDVALTVQDAWYSAIWTQQLTGQALQWVGINNYDVTSSTFDWEPEYYGCLTHTQLAIDKLEGNQVGTGIMQVVQAHMFGHVTALWGDVPFSDALKFLEGSTNPTYDDQLSVYAGVQTLLDEAIANLGGSGSDLGADLFYGGDASKWIAVAHTLKARFYLHTGDYANAITHANQGISTSADDMLFPHTGGVGRQDMNLWHSFLVIDRAGDVGATNAYLARLLDSGQSIYRGNTKTDESARFAYYYTGSNPSYGVNTGATGVFASTASDVFVSAVENQLILAEAHLRKSSPDASAALTALNAARQMNDAKFGGSLYSDYVLTDFDPAGIAGISGQTQSQALLVEIVEEKYASMFGQIEAFNDLKRTDNLIGLTPTVGSQIPERFLLPEEETNANSNAPSPIPGLYVPTTVNQ